MLGSGLVAGGGENRASETCDWIGWESRSCKAELGVAGHQQFEPGMRITGLGGLEHVPIYHTGGRDSEIHLCKYPLGPKPFTEMTMVRTATYKCILLDISTKSIVKQRYMYIKVRKD